MSGGQGRTPWEGELGELALWASGRRVFPARGESKDKGPEVGPSMAVGRIREAETRRHSAWL